jgi:hypothetical protein
MKKAIWIALGVLLAGAGVTYGGPWNSRPAVEFFKGHMHSEHGETTGAPQHSGGLDRFGCHNGSVPYHCH